MLKKNFFKFALASSAILLPVVALTSCSSVTTSLYFAELVVSDNTSVLKDKSFSETTYKGWRKFMTSNKIEPLTGHVSYEPPPSNEESNTSKLDDNKSQTYDKLAMIDMPEVDKSSKLLAQGKGIWRRPNKSRDLTFRQIFSGGTNLIIAPGFNHQQAIESVAPKEKDKGFLFLDGVPQIKDDSGRWIREYPNVSAFLFRAEQSGFLAGIAAGEFLNINQDIFTMDDGKLKVGGFVGLPLGSTVDFLAGFQHGIVAYNRNISKTNANTIDGKSKKQIEWVSLGNEIGNYSVGSFSPGQGTQKSKDLINAGVDMIIPIAGPQTSDVVSAINSQTKPRPITIVGVDSSQEESSVNKDFDSKIISAMDGKKLKDYSGKEIAKPEIIQFSAIKKLDEATIKVLSAIFNRNDPNNSNAKDGSVVKGFGYLNVGSLGNETAGISKRGLPYVLKAFPDWKKTSLTSKENINELDPNKVYENQEFKSLETNGRLYKNISSISNDKKLDELNDDLAVTSSTLSGQGNKLVIPMESGKYSPLPSKLYEKEKPLNGSHWGMGKNKTWEEEKNPITPNRREE